MFDYSTLLVGLVATWIIIKFIVKDLVKSKILFWLIGIPVLGFLAGIFAGLVVGAFYIGVTLL